MTRLKLHVPQATVQFSRQQWKGVMILNVMWIETGLRLRLLPLSLILIYAWPNATKFQNV